MAVPELREDRAEGELVLGVRPEHVRLSDDGWLRGEVFGAEYLGTTQIVTVRPTADRSARRLPAGRERAAAASTVGLALQPDKLSIFDGATGRAIRTALHEGGARMAEVVLDRVSQALRRRRGRRRPVAHHRRWRVRRPARSDRRRQDDDACASSPGSSAPMPDRSASAARDVTSADAGAARRRLRLPAILALSASDRLRQSRLPAALAGCAAWPEDEIRRAGDGDRAASAHRGQAAEPRRRGSPAARCSASRSAARWCAGRRST